MKNHVKNSVQASYGDHVSFVQKLIPPFILSLITIIVYLPSLWYPFQFDDIAHISKRFAIRFDNPLSRWWTNSRWLGDWLNRFNFYIGRFEPFSYRLVNLTIHLLAGMFVFLLIFRLCRFLQKESFLYKQALLIATATSALFLLHPVQSQTVSYVIQARVEGLATLFILAALTFFVYFFSVKNIILRLLFFCLFAASSFFSFGTKEIIIVMPFLLLLIDWFFISRQTWSQFKPRFFIYLLLGVAFFGLLIHYLGFDFVSRIVNLKAVSGNNRGNILTNNAYDVITPFHYLISEFKVVLHYLIIFLWPFNISVEYDWKLSNSFFSLDAFIPFIILSSILAFAIHCIVKKKYGHVAFGLLWFFICVAPRSTLIPSPELICDYKTYLASVGVLFLFSTFFVTVLLKLVERFPMFSLLNLLSGKKHTYEYHTVFSLIIIFLIPLSLGTLVRNRVWRSPVEFWQDNAKKSPNKARVHNNLGVALSEAGKIDESIESYKKALDLDKHYQDPLSNIAVAYSISGDLNKAIEALQKAIYISPDYPEAYNNLGSLLIQKKNYNDAERVLGVAIKLRPYYGKAYYNLARLYEAKNKPDKVWEYLKKATEGDLDLPEVFFKLGQVSLRLQKYKEAAQFFETTISRGLAIDQVWFNLANAYFMAKDHDKAETIYIRLLRDNPLEIRYAYNLAETLYSKKNYAHAYALFKKVTTLPKPLPQAFFRVAKCLESMKETTKAKEYLNQLLSLNTPDEFKKALKKEIARLSLQEKYIKGGRTVHMSDLRKCAKEIKEAETA